MPIVSQAQRKWMWANHPEMAKRWEAETPKGKKLPEYVNPHHSHPYSFDPWEPGKCMICGQGQKEHSIA